MRWWLSRPTTNRVLLTQSTSRSRGLKYAEFPDDAPVSRHFFTRRLSVPTGQQLDASAVRRRQIIHCFIYERLLDRHSNASCFNPPGIVAATVRVAGWLADWLR